MSAMPALQLNQFPTFGGPPSFLPLRGQEQLLRGSIAFLCVLEV